MLSREFIFSLVMALLRRPMLSGTLIRYRPIYSQSNSKVDGPGMYFELAGNQAVRAYSVGERIQVCPLFSRQAFRFHILNVVHGIAGVRRPRPPS